YLICSFFQAEDGIRDRNVTGVQTCALPIYELLRGVGEHLLRPLGKIADDLDSADVTHLVSHGRRSSRAAAIATVPPPVAVRSRAGERRHPGSSTSRDSASRTLTFLQR